MGKCFRDDSVYFTRELVILKVRMPFAIVKSNKVNLIGSELMYRKHNYRGKGDRFLHSISLTSLRAP